MPTATADADGVGTGAGTRSASATPLTPSPWRTWAHRIAGVRARAGRPVASASVTAFRVAFGLLVVFSVVRFVARGWVEEFYLAPDHHLTFAGFEWVRPLPVPLMYVHMGVLALLGLAIAVGVHTRVAAGIFAIGFAYVELIDAGLYLNHYWFVTLTAVVLALAPTPDRSTTTVAVATVWILRFQVAVVYVFAGLAKLNPDWLFEAQPMSIWLAARTDRPFVGHWLDEPLVALAFSWLGALFDLTIVGWLLWRRSRAVAYAAVVVFHVSTAMLFQIGVFPWVMIALTPIFFAPDWPTSLRRRLAGGPGAEHHGIGQDEAGSRSRPGDRPSSPPIAALTACCLVVLVAVNVFLPLRHYVASGNVRFNDDGYYLSWRVMLTERTGFLEFDVTDVTTGETFRVRPDTVLEDWQIAQATTRPDLALATAHLVAADFATRGHPEVRVNAESWVSFNGRPRQRWIDPAVDLADTPRDAPADAYVLPLDPAERP